MARNLIDWLANSDTAGDAAALLGRLLSRDTAPLGRPPPPLPPPPPPSAPPSPALPRVVSWDNVEDGGEDLLPVAVLQTPPLSNSEDVAPGLLPPASLEPLPRLPRAEEVVTPRPRRQRAPLSSPAGEARVPQPEASPSLWDPSRLLGAEQREAVAAATAGLRLPVGSSLLATTDGALRSFAGLMSPDRGARSSSPPRG